MQIGAFKFEMQDPVKSNNNNIKATLAGPFKALNFRKYAQPKPAAFTCRLIQRLNLRNLLATLNIDLVRIRSTKEKLLEAGTLKYVFNQESYFL